MVSPQEKQCRSAQNGPPDPDEKIECAGREAHQNGIEEYASALRAL
jgi:hypothetical protein